LPSLYRKWRSRTFDDLVGQPHVVRTLKNAVREHQVAHAYLFTGPRGTGKTSTARILAKAVNCLDPQDGNPDNACEACRAADEGRAIDVIEIDAASHTGVENVRELRERVAYAAGEGRYKVYIVDEVHRLSPQAFDAFLKTLEEPPAHVIFVFASTEPHKVPATITSRCQRFDFRRISVGETLARLQKVARGESLDVSDEALQLIALQAAGSLRDALGLLDQVTSYAPGRVDEADVRNALGVADPLLISRLTEHLLGGQPGPGLAEAGRFVEAGGDPMQLLKQLIEYWRLLLLQVSGLPPGELEMDPILRERVGVHARSLTESDALAVLQALTRQEYSGKYNLPTSLPLEAGYVEAALRFMRAGGNVGERRPIAVTPPGASAGAEQPAAAVSPAMDAGAGESPANPGATFDGVAGGGPAAESESPDVAGGGAAAGGSLSLGHPTVSDAQQLRETPAPSASPPKDMWEAILEGMRSKSKSIRALLRDGYLMQIEAGEVTIGFLYPFHANQFADAKKRRLLEQVVSEVLGSPHRVRCLKVTRDDIESVQGAGAVVEDDGFVEEAAARLRELHFKELGNGSS
jgi:DNA polymerase-3 subunit gamma/tau